jgi:hypothetical protein
MNAAVNNENIVKRSKSFKTSLNPEISKIILNAATALTLDIIEKRPKITATSIKNMRKVLEPAYEAMLPLIKSIINNSDIKTSDLSGLGVDLNPSLGSWSFKINCKLNGKTIQPLMFFILATDGNNCYMRSIKGGADVFVVQKLFDKV